MLSLVMSRSKPTLEQKHALLASSRKGHDYNKTSCMLSFVLLTKKSPKAPWANLGQAAFVRVKATYLNNQPSNVNKLMSFSC